MDSLATYLFGATRTAILAALLVRPADTYHVRELARITGVSPGTLHRELTALAALGILHRNRVGRQVFYSANRDSPIFAELSGLLRKTAGLVDVIRDALQPIAKRITAAFLYGSMAAGEETARSDADVMIVGKVTFAEAVKALSSTERALRREVNPTVMTREVFRRKRRAGDSFVSSLWTGPKLWVLEANVSLDSLRRMSRVTTKR
jgi:DNA-binding transcriptional ArsR family regulator